MLFVGLVAGALLGWSGSESHEQESATVAQVDHWAEPDVELSQESDEEVEVWWEWDRPVRDPDDEAGMMIEAQCSIDILNRVGLEISVLSVFALGDWADMAYGGPCEYLEALTDGRPALADR
jgi:hypothetical protein